MIYFPFKLRISDLIVMNKILLMQEEETKAPEQETGTEGTETETPETGTEETKTEGTEETKTEGEGGTE